MNLETNAVYFRGIHADVRARGRNNKPPPPLSASGATGGMYTRRGDLLFMYKKKYNHTALLYFNHTVSTTAEHFFTLRAINALTGALLYSKPVAKICIISLLFFYSSCKLYYVYSCADKFLFLDFNLDNLIFHGRTVDLQFITEG